MPRSPVPGGPFNYAKNLVTQRSNGDFICNECGYNFYTPRDKSESFWRKVAIHNYNQHGLGKKQFPNHYLATCPQCNWEKAVSSKQNKEKAEKTHQQYMHGSGQVSREAKTSVKANPSKATHSYKCPECNESFGGAGQYEAKRKLERHRASEHGVNEQVSATCKKCGKKFTGVGPSDLKLTMYGHVQKQHRAKTVKKVQARQERIREETAKEKQTGKYRPGYKPVPAPPKQKLAKATKSERIAIKCNECGKVMKPYYTEQEATTAARSHSRDAHANKQVQFTKVKY